MTEPDAPHPTMGRAFQLKSDAELQRLYEQSGVGSIAYEGAVREIDRRRNARLDGDQRTAFRQQMIWIKLTFWAAVIVGILGIAVTAVISLL